VPHSFPGDPVALAAAPERVEPEPGQVVSECCYRLVVAGHGVVGEVAFLKFTVGFTATLAIVAFMASSGSASQPTSEEIRRNLEFVPIADESGNPLQADDGRFVVLQMKEYSEHSDEIYNEIASLHAASNESAEGKQEYEEMAASVFGDTASRSDGEVASIFGPAENYKTDIDGVQLVQSLHGRAWLEPSTRSVLDPRRFVTLVTKDELDAILLANRESGAVEE
jgi:hypothetical protein